ncbi:unnamed protein product [Caenorhabditis brenneri]
MWDIFYFREECLEGKPWLHVVTDILAMTVQIITRRCSSLLALFIAAFRAFSVIFPMSNAVNFMMKAKSGYLIVLLVASFLNSSCRSAPRPSYQLFRFTRKEKWENRYRMIDGSISVVITFSYLFVVFALVIALAAAQKRRKGLKSDKNFIDDMDLVAIVFVIINSCNHCIICFFMSSQYRDVVKRLVCCCKKEEKVEKLAVVESEAHPTTKTTKVSNDGIIDIQNTNLQNLSFLENVGDFKIDTYEDKEKIFLNLKNNPQMTRFGMTYLKEIQNGWQTGIKLANFENLHPDFCLTIEEIAFFLENYVSFVNFHAKICADNRTKIHNTVICQFESMSRLPGDCNMIIGDLIVNPGDEPHFNKIEKLRYLFGSVVIQNTSLEDLDMLNGIRYVLKLNESQPVIQVVGNKKIEQLFFRDLEVVSVDRTHFNTMMETVKYFTGRRVGLTRNIEQIWISLEAIVVNYDLYDVEK